MKPNILGFICSIKSLNNSHYKFEPHRLQKNKNKKWRSFDGFWSYDPLQVEVRWEVYWWLLSWEEWNVFTPLRGMQILIWKWPHLHIIFTPYLRMWYVNECRHTCVYKCYACLIITYVNGYKQTTQEKDLYLCNKSHSRAILGFRCECYDSILYWILQFGWFRWEEPHLNC